MRDIASKIRADEVAFNNVISGCVSYEKTMLAKAIDYQSTHGVAPRA